MSTSRCDWACWPTPALVSRKLAEAPRLLAASPSYLERRERPRDPADLAAHALILGPGGAGPDAWTFIKSGRRVSIRVEGRLTSAANEGAVAAATAGLGITVTSLWACRDELERGVLERVMEDWTMDPVEVHAVFPAGRAASPAGRAFIDYLAPLLRGGG